LYQRITVDLDDHVLLIGINRPDKRNAFDLAALEQLSAAYQRLGEDAQARVGVLYAHGAHFSAGLDLGEVGPVVAERPPSRTCESCCRWCLEARTPLRGCAASSSAAPAASPANDLGGARQGIRRAAVSDQRPDSRCGAVGAAAEVTAALSIVGPPG
jgi:hypothetical protein